MDKKDFSQCLREAVQPETFRFLVDRWLDQADGFYALVCLGVETRDRLRKAMSVDAHAFWRLILRARRQLDTKTANFLKNIPPDGDFPLGAWPEPEKDND